MRMASFKVGEANTFTAKEAIVKPFISAVLAASALVVPALSFAQSNDTPVTHAQVRAELVQLEKAGYQPGRDDPHYPADIQTAEVKVAAMNRVASGYGGVANGSSDAGRPAVSAADLKAMYSHH
jgi:hypothetical protein